MSESRFLSQGTGEQEQEGFSIEAQLRLLREYAGKNGIAIAREFLDVETAKRSGRSQFGEMVEYVRKQPTRTILVEKTDRLYRNLRDWVTIDELDAEIHLVKEGEVLSKDSHSHQRFIHGIKVLMAKNYVENLGEEASKGMREKAEQGIWPSRAPIGYLNVVGPDGKRVIEPDPERAPLVTKLFERYATGRYSLLEVATHARTDGLTMPRSGRTVPRTTLHAALRNRIYMGDFEWNGIVYSGSHEPLVSPELWDRVQEVLSGRNERKPHKVRHDFAFSRFVTCGHCGCALVGEAKKERYVYYHCTGNRGDCGEPYVREEVLAAAFGDILNGLRLDDDVVTWLREGLKASQEDEKHHHREAIARLRGEADRLQGRIEAIYVDKLDGKITEEFYERKSREWRRELKQVSAHIEAHQEADEDYMDQGVSLIELASQARSLYDAQTSTEKRRLLNFLCSNSSWADGKLTVEFRQPFDLIATTNVAYQEKKAAGDTSDDLCPVWRPQRALDHIERPVSSP